MYVAKDKSKIVAAIPGACADERLAVEFFEKQRWGDGQMCPRCGGVNVYKMADLKTGERNKRFLWRCRVCKGQYTVRIGTVFEDSRIPLKHWCYAFWRACTSKKGVAALEIKRHTGLTYKSALFMMHRIRYAMADEPMAGGPFKGTAEVDETYCGGKAENRRRNKDGGLMTKKQTVIAIVERGGRVKARHFTNVTGKNVGVMIRETVHHSARVITDGGGAYHNLDKSFRGEHKVIRHDMGQYVRDGDIHTNTVEGFFSLIKRGLMGIYHAVSKEHLHRYIAEYQFRYNGRYLEDGERTVAAIRGAEGKRLTYRQVLS